MFWFGPALTSASSQITQISSQSVFRLGVSNSLEKLKEWSHTLAVLVPVCTSKVGGHGRYNELSLPFHVPAGLLHSSGPYGVRFKSMGCVTSRGSAGLASHNHPTTFKTLSASYIVAQLALVAHIYCLFASFYSPANLRNALLNIFIFAKISLFAFVLYKMFQIYVSNFCHGESQRGTRGNKYIDLWQYIGYEANNVYSSALKWCRVR
jgi:hypothetical protein